MSLGAREFGASSTITTAQHKEYSVELNLHANAGAYGTQTKKITSNLVLGMGFVTGTYFDLTPVLHSGVMYLNLERATSSRPNLEKWKVSS